MQKAKYFFLVSVINLLFLQGCGEHEPAASSLPTTDSVREQLKVNTASVTLKSSETINPVLTLAEKTATAVRRECNAFVYVVSYPKGGVPLLNNQKQVVTHVTFNKEDEYFLIIEAKASKDGLFQIKTMETAFEETPKPKQYENLWIEGKYLNIYLSDAIMTLKLYGKPSLQSKIIYRIDHKTYSEVDLTACSGKWFYGRYKEDKGAPYGWFDPDNTASNPITNS